MSPSEAAPPPKRTLFRFWFPWIALALAALLVLFIWRWPEEKWERASRVAATILVTAGTFLALILWLFIYFRRGWWLAVLGLTTLVIAAAASVRDLKKDGDIVPTFIRFRWEPSQDEIIEAHRRQQAGETPAGPLAAVQPTDYPEYRGRLRDGIVHGPPLNRDWKSQPPRRLWRQPVGGGYAGFVVVGTSAFTLEQRREREAVVCYDTDSGKERWVHAYAASFTEALGGPGPRATPTVFDGDVYSLGATGHLVCLDGGTGKEKWAADILQNNDNITWAMSGSPLVFDDVVVVNPGLQTKFAAGAVAAYERQTGRLLWSTGSTRAGYASPMLATLAGQQQILIFDAEELAGYHPRTGLKLWRFPWVTYQGINVAQPIVLPDNRLCISAGYNHGSALIQVSETDGVWEAKQLWTSTALRSKFANPVAYQGNLYGLDDGTLVCLDLQNGARRWKGNRYGHGQLLLSGDLLVILSETGQLALVEASPLAPRQLASLQAITGRTWNYLAIANGKVYVRNDVEMACYDLAK